MLIMTFPLKIVVKWMFKIFLILFLLDKCTRQLKCDCDSTYQVEQSGQHYCVGDYQNNSMDFEPGVTLSNGVRLYEKNGPIKYYRCLLSK